MKNRFESIFNNLTDSEFEDILRESGLKFKKVNKNEGGLFIAGKKVSSNELREEYIKITQMYRKETFLIEDRLNKKFNLFDVKEEYILVA